MSANIARQDFRVSLRRALTRGLVIATATIAVQVPSHRSAAQTAAAVDAPGTPFIAGTEPSLRPLSAPRITVFEKNQEWYQRALIGISAPYPASLRFLE